MSSDPPIKQQVIQPVFIDIIPDEVEQGKLYISEKYGTAIHKCCCGCGEEVVTPLSPVEWRLKKSPRGVSLSPSIGNWSYTCRSHYFITDNRVVWAGAMTDRQIEIVKSRDQRDMERYIAQRNQSRQDAPKAGQQPVTSASSFGDLIEAVIRWFKSLFK